MEIKTISIDLLHDFKNHPFRVVDDDEMKKMVESVKEYGVHTPIIVRPNDDSEYEIVSGHRRKRACVLAGIKELPAIVRDLDDDEATIMMVDSNIQRENVTPMEKARAWQMKEDAMKRKAGRPSKENCSDFRNNLRTYEIIAKEAGVGKDTVHRHLRLNKLEKPFQSKVDNRGIPVTAAADISFLSPIEQRDLLDVMNETGLTPSGKQAKKMKQMSAERQVTHDDFIAIMKGEADKPKEDDMNIIATGEKANVTVVNVGRYKDYGIEKVNGKYAHVETVAVNRFQNLKEELELTINDFLDAVASMRERYESDIDNETKTQQIKEILKAGASELETAFD